MTVFDEIANIIRGNKLGLIPKKLYKEGKFIFEHNERVYAIRQNEDKTILFAKYTGLEVNPPEMIYSFTATYDKQAFEIMIKHFNKLYP